MFGLFILRFSGQPLSAASLALLSRQTITDRSAKTPILGVPWRGVIATVPSIPKSPVAQSLARESVNPGEFGFADPSRDVLCGGGSGFRKVHTAIGYAR
jgi:hypothetical protein